MEKNDTDRIIISDTGPIIHLDELNHLYLLDDFKTIIIPETVYNEILLHRSEAFLNNKFRYQIKKNESGNDKELESLFKLFSLHKGEQEAFYLIKPLKEAIFLTDDAAARLAAIQSGINVHGTIGILIRAIRRGIKTNNEIISILKSINTKSSLFICQSLVNEIINKLNNYK